jgi:hypothetical protein
MSTGSHGAMILTGENKKTAKNLSQGRFIALKMETQYLSETLTSTYKFTWRQIHINIPIFITVWTTKF